MERKVITLNVGGTKFTTSLDTLIGEPNTVFAHMFGGVFENKPNEDNEYYFDRDPELFPLILNHMRGYDILPKVKADNAHKLETDAKFYGLQSLVSLLNGDGKECLKFGSRLCVFDHYYTYYEHGSSISTKDGYACQGLCMPVNKIAPGTELEFIITNNSSHTAHFRFSVMTGIDIKYKEYPKHDEYLLLLTIDEDVEDSFQVRFREKEIEIEYNGDIKVHTDYIPDGYPAFHWDDNATIAVQVVESDEEDKKEEN